MPPYFFEDGTGNTVTVNAVDYKMRNLVCFMNWKNHESVLSWEG